MPKQESILKVRGTIDELTFYKKNGEYLVRRKGGVTKERILSDPNFERTRENMQQFKSIAENLKLFRDSFPVLKRNVPGKLAFLPISRLMYRVSKLDTNSPRGERKLTIGLREPQGIESFVNLSLSRGSNLSQIFTAPMEVDRVTGTVSSGPFVPEHALYYPESATHFNVQTAVVVINFDTLESKVQYSTMVQEPIELAATTIVMAPPEMPIVPGNTSTFVLVTVTFSQMSNGVLYPLKSSASSAIQIIDAFNS